MNYRSPRWLPGAHLQTIWPALLLKPRLPALRREIWTTPDDDVLAVDWLEGQPGKPLLIHFHGLEGSSRSHYARALLRHLQALGWAGAVVHFRGCGGVENRRDRAYHAGDSAEIDWILRRMQGLHPQRRRFAFGISLGGNALLKWLGEQGDAAASVLTAAAAVSVPYDLLAVGDHLDRGLNRWFYSRHFLKTLKRKARRLSADQTALDSTTTLRRFDDLVTARLHGFRDVDDYWTRASSRPLLRSIALPTLLLHARNDPFMPVAALPQPDELAASTELQLLDQGGHAGFVSGTFPGRLDWLPRHVCSWLDAT